MRRMGRPVHYHTGQLVGDDATRLHHHCYPPVMFCLLCCVILLLSSFQHMLLLLFRTTNLLVSRKSVDPERTKDLYSNSKTQNLELQSSKVRWTVALLLLCICSTASPACLPEWWAGSCLAVHCPLEQTWAWSAWGWSPQSHSRLLEAHGCLAYRYIPCVSWRKI